MKRSGALELLAVARARAASAAAACLAVAATGCGAGGPTPAQDADRGEILAITIPPDASTTHLRRLDADTLTPRGGAVDLGEYHEAWAFSPDGRALAVGTFARTGVRLVDPVALRIVRDVPMPIAAVAVGWVGPDRIAVLLQKGGVVIVEASSGRIERRWPLSYRLPCSGRRAATTPSGVVFVVAARRGGAVRLLRVDGDGDLRTRALARVRAPATRRTCGSPGFAVDPSGRRALVAGSRGPVAEVDLASLAVTYRSVRGLPRGLRARPSCRSRRPLCTGPRTLDWPIARTAVLAGSNAGRAAGAVAIDTTAWSARPIDSRAADLEVAEDGAVLSFGGSGGLRASRLGGALRWTALRGTRVRAVAVAGTQLYALDDPPRATRILAARTGAVVGRAGPLGRLEILTGRREAQSLP